MAAADFVPLAGYTTLQVLAGGTKPLSQRTLGAPMRHHVCQVRIDSYFSVEIDLADGMRTWPEFVEGKGYDADLQSEDEDVSVRIVDKHDDEPRPNVLVRGVPGGQLFLVTLGYVTYAMSGASDDVITMRWEGPDVTSQKPPSHEIGKRPKGA